MTTITIPAELEKPLAEAARKLGTAPERLVVNWLRDHLEPPPASPGEAAESLLDFLSGYIGTVDGSGEHLSESCGERFMEGLAGKQWQNSP